MNEFSAGILQTIITLGLAAVCLYLYRRYRKPYFAYWSVAWLLYVTRLGAIHLFLVTEDPIWLYWHQVVTGWTALALLWAALTFSQQIRFRTGYLIWFLFPPVWSFLAIYQLDNFLAAAGPAVIFLSLATFWTGASLWRYHRRVGSNAAILLAVAFWLWSLHHFDYPFLRARGAWNPWGYYLDIFFELAVGTGFLLLVLEDVHRGLGTLSDLASDLQKRRAEEGILQVVLGRLLSLPAVTGSALHMRKEGGGLTGAGICREWTWIRLRDVAGEMIDRVFESGRPEIVRNWIDEVSPTQATHSYVAILPVFLDQEVVGTILIIGEARDPFAALDTDFLVALGRQVGAALQNADLDQKLQARTDDLERLAARMVRQHEEERQRLSRELHDESAQVFSAVKLQLGVLRETAPAEMNETLDVVIGLIETGIRSIRSVTEDLRPSLLDDLGLLPALRALSADFTERTRIQTRLDFPTSVPALSEEAELALFRALQEGMSNVAQHSGARTVNVTMRLADRELRLELEDNGRGLVRGETRDPFALEGHMGLSGMRERIHALGGSVTTGEPRGIAASDDPAEGAPHDNPGEEQRTDDDGKSGFALIIRLPITEETRS